MRQPAFRSTWWFTATAAIVGYTLSVVVLTWPLAPHLTTALLGDPMGDTGVYVWNIWIFRHELLTHGHLPFSTDHIFAYTGGADFSLHNYTPLAGLAGTVLIPWIGVVGAFNVVLMACMTTAALGVFLLGREIGLRRASAWGAGVLFIAAPLVSARETAHLSLITAAPLPLFLWALLRTLDRPRLRAGALVGFLVAMATYSDAYYGIYCVMMGAFLIAWRFFRLEQPGSTVAPSRALPWITAAGLLVSALLVWRVVSGNAAIFVGPIRVGIRSLYTPVLALVVLAGLRAWLRWRPSVRFDDPAGGLRALIKPGVLAIVVCLTLLSPLLAGLANRYAEGRLPDTVTYWRSSPRGVDLLGYLVPNPTHAWFGQWTERWLLPDVADAFPDLVAGFSILAVVGIALAAWRRVLPTMWVAFTVVFVLLSLGPFIHVGGVNTFVIGPWALLRYIPVVGMARSPSRFAIVAALGLSVLSAFALQAWLARKQRRWTMSAAVLVLLIALEVIPAPRALYSARVPDVYRLIAADADDDSEEGRLLELPTGIRDGTSSIGDFSASTEFFQTRHGRPLIGGYLSRVSDWRKKENLRTPMLKALYELSERPGPLPHDVLDAARQSREEFLARSCVKYVVVDKQRASSELQAFALEVLGLMSVHEDDRYQLLTPGQAPTCEPPPSGPGAHAAKRGAVSATQP